MAAAASSNSSPSTTTSSSRTTLAQFAKWLAVVVGLSLLSLVVTSSYNRLLSTPLLAAPEWHQQSHAAKQQQQWMSSHGASNENASSAVILLLSFPNSGTSYTLENTQTISNLTVATSYDQELVYDGGPLFVGAYEQSPYILNASLARPSNILTKTHCGGHCEVCAPITHVSLFEQECLSLTKFNPTTNRNQRITYGALPQKAVHLVRNPHDNLVARMHMGIGRRKQRLGWTDAQLEKFSYDEKGFKEWCSYVDSLYKGDLKGTLREQHGLSDDVLEQLPCLSEWFRYVMWHNNAIAMLQSHDIPAFVLYYEEYTDHYAQAVNDLFQFLSLEQVMPPEPFIAGKTYESYYTDNQRHIAAELVEKLASPLCWKILRGYFTTSDERQNEQTTKTTTDSLAAKTSFTATETAVMAVPTTKVSESLPVVSLLVSFPNSGTSYTLKNTMITSNLSVATNYEQEVKATRIPLRPDLELSPYVLKPAFQLPHNVLTKTHCAGYCEQCDATDLDEFEYHCLVRTRTIVAGQAFERLPYSRDLVKQTIHLFRDPFDNLVARMHLGIDRRRVVKKWSDERLSAFSNTPRGMKAWCEEVDNVFRGDFDQAMKDMDVPAALHEDLPCKTDWYRYVMWHNRAVELIERWNVPNHVVYYEDYTRRYNETVAGILGFLGLDAVHANYPFYSGKTYRSLYDDDTGRKAAAFAQRIASPQCWNLIQHYFASYLSAPTNAQPKVALLLSYPNSGTSYTILNTEQITNATTATNHGQEVVERIPLRPDVSDGPFIHRPKMDIPALVLTKTHCTGYNFQDIPATSMDAFRDKCLTATWSEAGLGLRKVTYGEELVEKAVHLVRSPWDNMVSRMHHAIKNAAKLKLSKAFLASITSADPKENLRSWCAYVDGLLPSNVRDAMGKADSELTRLPCHTDLLRYVWWHNWALEMTDSMALPVHVLHYEQYTTDYKETVADLYKFLKQPIRRPPLPFVEGKSYRDHFNDDYLQSASKMIRSLASDMTLSLVSRYLVNQPISEPLPVPRQTRKLAWLLSFPNSGTSYTITNIQRVSNTSAASNYVSETQPGATLPVRRDLKDGPYLTKPERNVPQLVLTKTHCAGYCDGCASHAFLNTVISFERGCREAHGRDKTDRRHYDETPVKAVHIFRDIFDNLVARKHLGMKLRTAANPELAQSAMNEDSHKGFLAWCSYNDEISAADGDLSTFLEPEQLTLSRGVPCAFELYRYVRWHTLALEMTDRLDIPVHYVYYEDYGKDLEGTVQGLVEFLDVPAVGPSIEFLKGKTYGDLFSDEDARAMALYVRSLASDECWSHLSRYLGRWTGDQGAEVVLRASEERTQPNIAWLLSFPNSGTSYTLENTMAVTGSSVATNYANEVNQTSPMRTDVDVSPFLIDPALRVDDLVLTKTHCNPKDNYVSFRDGCQTLRTTVKNATFDRMYPMGLVEKAVHLIRDPVDNIVARMHHGISNRSDRDTIFDPSLRNVTDPKALFRPWCSYIDRKYWAFGHQKSWVTQAAVDLFSQVPCYTDVLHYVVWHNLALQMLDQESIPSYHLYYEDYTSDFQRSTLRLYTEFLHFPMTGQPAEFVPGKSYRDYFTDTERLALAKLIREVASPKCWSLLRHYFTDWLGSLEVSDIAPAAWPGQDEDVKVAWLLSFPNSGTTFTLANTEKLSNTTTAANYAQGHDACVPIRPGLSDGPFIHDLNLAVPHVVLTKTHCSGYCDDCNLSRSFQTLESFERGCGSGQKRISHKFVPSYYPSSIPDRIVHLIRDPIDNIVSRMHHGVMRRREFLGWSKEKLTTYSNSKEGIHRWCSLVDENFWDKIGLQAGWIPEPTRDLMKAVPCAADFFRYAHWHNNAVELMGKLGRPIHTMHYEDYSTAFDTTTDSLFAFLDLSRKPQVSDFVAGKTYRGFFAENEVEDIARLIRNLATEQSWNLLKRYFPDKVTESDAQIRSPVVEVEPKVAWLMSFPNSGTSYTITNLKEITQKATATNYLEGEAMRFKPLYPGHDEGPYVKDPFFDLPEYVLTKTHCDGYCDLCNQETSRHTVDSFERGCASGTRWIDGEKEVVTYSSKLPRKAVHLLRSPFDNIVARMHLGIEKRRKGGWSDAALAQFNDTSAGVLSWCKHVDGRFQENARRPLFTDDQKSLLKQLPCYSEWFRYTQWHSLVIQVIQRLEIPSHTMFYESYTTDFDSTVQDLLNFLELDAVKDSKDFYAGKTYRGLFLPEHRQIASKVTRLLATEECWKLLEHYFDEKLMDDEAIART